MIENDQYEESDKVTLIQLAKSAYSIYEGTSNAQAVRSTLTNDLEK
ncbi:MAG: hypothetical protein P8P74_11085 [Crocinitomicaceae bacterium]|nr:hypothetical protein [Crocinitomicaceae bacterium]